MPAKTSPSSIRCLSALSLGYLKVCLMFSAEMRSLEFYPYLLGRTKAADTQRVWKCQHTLCHSVLSPQPGGSEGSFSEHPLLCCAVNTSIIQTRTQGAEPTVLHKPCVSHTPGDKPASLQSLPLLPSPPCHLQSAQSLWLF